MIFDALLNNTSNLRPDYLVFTHFPTLLVSCFIRDVQYLCISQKQQALLANGLCFVKIASYASETLVHCHSLVNKKIIF